MLLNNFISLLRNGISKNNPTIKNIDNINVQITGNTSLSYIDPLKTSPYVVNNYSSGNYGLVFGDGTTPPQLTDYNLENVVETFTTSNTNISITNNKLILGQVVTATSDMTISEVGVFLYTVSDYSKTKRCILARTVLSEPVVLQAGDSKTFTAEIDFNSFIDNVNNL